MTSKVDKKITNRTLWTWHPWSNFTETSTNYGKFPSKTISKIGKDFLKEMGAWDPPYKIERDANSYKIFINVSEIVLGEVKVFVKENIYNENMLSVKSDGNPKFHSTWVVPIDGDAKQITSEITKDRIILTIPKFRERPLSIFEMFGQFLK